MTETPDADRVNAYAEALTSDWHDATCPEGKDCRAAEPEAGETGGRA